MIIDSPLVGPGSFLELANQLLHEQRMLGHVWKLSDFDPVRVHLGSDYKPAPGWIRTVTNFDDKNHSVSIEYTHFGDGKPEWNWTSFADVEW